MCVLCLLEEDFLPSPVAPGQWRDKGEQIFMPQEHAAYIAKPDYIATKKTPPPPSTAPRHDDPLSRHRFSYLNGGGGSGKPRERSSSSVPETSSSSTRPIAWPKRCGPGASRLLPLERPERLETFLDWLEGRGVQVICCGDQGQPPPIAGEIPHDWLREHVNYYKEVEVDHRAKDPLIKALKRDIRLQPDRVQCRAMRKALPG